MPPRRRLFGVHHLVTNIIFSSRQFQSSQPWSHQFTPFVIVAYGLRRFRCLDAVSCCHTRIELFRRPTLSSTHPSVIHQASISLLRNNSLFHGWTTATRLLPVRHVSYSTDLSLSWTQPPDCFSMSGSTIMSLRFCATFTGCVYRRESNTVWRCWRYVFGMEWLRRGSYVVSSVCE